MLLHMKNDITRISITRRTETWSSSLLYLQSVEQWLVPANSQKKKYKHQINMKNFQHHQLLRNKNENKAHLSITLSWC